MEKCNNNDKSQKWWNDKRNDQHDFDHSDRLHFVHYRQWTIVLWTWINYYPFVCIEKYILYILLYIYMTRIAYSKMQCKPSGQSAISIQIHIIQNGIYTGIMVWRISIGDARGVLEFCKSSSVLHLKSHILRIDNNNNNREFFFLFW